MLLTKIFKISLVSAFILLTGGLQAAHADSTPMTIGCLDGTDKISVNQNKDKHTTTVTCKSGAKINYQTVGRDATNQLTITCPGSESSGSSVDAANKPTSKIVFYCSIVVVAGGEPHATRTNHTPTVKVSNDPATVDSSGGTDISCANGNEDKALCAPKCKDSNDCNFTKTYINPFINKFLAPLAILAVVIGIIWGAIEYSTAAGDAQKVASGKGKIQKALIGLLGFIFLYALLNWIIPGGLI
jgi:hypothetical protein